MTRSQKLWSGIFYAQLAVQLGASVWLLASQNTSGEILSGGGCTGDWKPWKDTCISPGLWAKQAACVPTQVQGEGTTGRLLASTQGELNTWEMMAANGGIVAAVIPLTLALCALWLFLLTKAPGCVTWSSFVANGLVMCYGYYLTGNWMLLVSAAVLAVLVALAKKHIDLAIQAMHLAAEALQASPSVFFVCAAIQIVWAVYGICFYFVVSALGSSKDVDPDCELTGLSPAARFFTTVCPLLMVITMFYFQNCILAACSLSVGCWYFPDEAAEAGVPPLSPAVLGVQLALTTSSGTVFGASVVMGFIEYVRNQTQDGSCWWCHPLGCFVRLLWCCLEGVIGSLSRFALIGHMFLGEGLCDVAGTTYDVLRRQLPGVIVTGLVSEKVMSQISMGLATGLGFAVWAYLDAKEDLGIFKDLQFFVSNVDDVKSKQMIIVVLTLAMLYAVRNPLLSMFLIVFTGSGYWQNNWFSSFSVALLCACMGAVVFRYFGSIMEYSTDTVFYCLALETESGKRQVRLKPLYDTMRQQALADSVAADMT